MKLLLDSHVILWALDDPDELDAAARAALEDPANDVWYSTASVWELSIKAAAGKLTLPEEFFAAVGATGFEALAIDVEHAVRAGGLVPIHRDPFDRMLVAQAQTEGLVLMTRDRIIPQYGVATFAA